MKINWIEKLAQEGHIRPEAKEVIYSHCQDLIKSASTESMLNSLEGGMKDILKSSIPTAIQGAVGIGTLGLVSLLVRNVRDKKDLSRTIKDVHQTRMHLLKQPSLAKYPEKVDARINEIVSIAPGIIHNKTLLQRLVEDRLHDGLTASDATKLSILQASITPRLGKQEMMRSGMAKAIQEKRAAVAGRVLADMFYICKEAAAVSPEVAKKARGEAMKNLLKTTALISAFPLLQGLTTGAIKHLSSAKDRRLMEDAHKKSFEEALRLSDPEKEPLHANKEVAKQMFSALVHFAPHVAMEPQAARAFMNRFVRLDLGMGSSDIRELSEIEKNMRQGGNAAPFLEGLFKTLDNSRLSETVQRSVVEGTAPLQHKIKSSMGEMEGLHMARSDWQ